MGIPLWSTAGHCDAGRIVALFRRARTNEATTWDKVKKAQLPSAVFMLADDFLAAAERAHTAPRLRSTGPVRLLCYHACELYLKAFLRSHGADLEALRSHRHDLASLLQLAEARGLDSREIRGGIGKATEANEYVRVALHGGG